MWVIVAAVLLASSVLGHEGHDHGHDHSGHGADMPRLPLTIYYESLCSDSIKFFRDQLVPTYKTLKPHLNVKFVPYGKSTQRYAHGTFEFECHHKENECYGNIVQACAIKELHAEDDVYNVVTCLMTSVDPKTNTNETYPTEKCLNQYNLKPDILKNCIESPTGHAYLSEMGNITAKLQPPLKSVPSVQVNGNFGYELSKSAVDNLKSFLCKELSATHKNLTECNGATFLTSSLLLIVLTSLVKFYI